MLKLSDIMRDEVVTVGPESTLRDAVELFATLHISGAPVVAGERVVGVVSTSDILSFAASNPTVPTDHGEEAENEYPEPTEAEEVEEENDASAAYFVDLWADAGAEVSERMTETEGPEWDILSEHIVAEVMTRRLHALPPDADVVRAAEVMAEARIHRVLVMSGEQLLGVVSTMDVTSAVARLGWSEAESPT